MRVLWVTNMPVPELAGQLGLQTLPYGGWLVGFFEYLKAQEDVSVVSCFLGQDWREGQVEAGRYYSFPLARVVNRRYIDVLTAHFRAILRTERPDVIHVFGTEFAHTYAMVRAAGAEGFAHKVVVNIQGLCGVCAERYYDLLPRWVIYRPSLRDAYHMSFLWLQRMNYAAKARYERLALESAAHIVGRTDWDRALTAQANPEATYHFCNEILRPAFYREKPGWDVSNCERHSLLMGQGSYPIKGLHAAVQALAIVVKKVPDARLYVAGPPLRRGSYQRYVARLMREHGLEHSVRFLGPLDEEELRARLAKSHVLILPSFAENESNTVSEAKMVGTPVVGSFVGGLPNRVRHGEDGFCYPATAPYMLAYHVLRLFADDALALSFSRAGKAAAERLFDRETNGRALLDIYAEIAGDQQPEGQAKA